MQKKSEGRLFEVAPPTGVDMWEMKKILELWSSGNECFTSFVVLVFDEVLDESSCEVFCFFFPLCGISVGITRIEDVGINAFELCGHGEVEVGDGLRGCLIDGVVEDGVDDAACILDGDALSCSVPTGVNEVGLGSALFHSLDEFFCIFCWVQFKECLSEAS